MAILLALREEADETGHILTPGEIASRFRPQLTTISAENSLDHLYRLGVVDWRLNDESRAAYFISREGARIVDENFEHRQDDESWVIKHHLALDLDALVASAGEKPEQRTKESPKDAQESVGTVIFQNNYTPTQSQSVSQSNTPVSDPSGRSAARAGWTNVWVALAVGVIVVVVTAWAAGKLPW